MNLAKLITVAAECGINVVYKDQLIVVIHNDRKQIIETIVQEPGCVAVEVPGQVTRFRDQGMDVDKVLTQRLRERVLEAIRG